MLQQEVEIINKLGLHARASAKLTQLASNFKCEVMLSRNNRRVNAKGKYVNILSCEIIAGSHHLHPFKQVIARSYNFV